MASYLVRPTVLALVLVCVRSDTVFPDRSGVAVSKDQTLLPEQKGVSVVQATIEKISEKYWDATHVSPKPLMTVAYQNFRVCIYPGTEIYPNSTYYYYAPALILDPTAVKTTYNPFTDIHEVVVPILMWNEAYEKTVQEGIARRIGRTVPPGSIQLLPIHAIRVDTDSHDYHVLNKWMSYANQHHNMTFFLSCASTESCSVIRQSIQEFPDRFVADLHVYSSLKDVRTQKRELVLKGEHTSGAEMFTALLKEHIKRNTVYLHAVDYKELVRGIVQSVITQESDDDEFISQDQVRVISRLIDSSLEKRRVSTTTFTSDMWNAVYWSDEMHCARPDVVTDNLNKLYNTSSPPIQEIIKKEMSLPTVGNCSAGTGVNVSAFTTAAVASSLLSKEARNRLVRVLLQAKELSEWNGDKFTVIPMSLIRINVSAFRTAIVATTQMTMAPTGFDLSSRITVVDQQTVTEATTAPARTTPSPYACSKKSLRHSGAANWPSYSTIPAGIFCIGNSASPTPSRNFLSLYKYTNGTIAFEGSESLNGGFIDFTQYLQATVNVIDTPGNKYIIPLDEGSACWKLPELLRGNLTGINVGCSRNNPGNWIHLQHSGGYDSVIDNDGSLTCMDTSTETLWY